MESELTILVLEILLGGAILGNVMFVIGIWFWVRRERRAAFIYGVFWAAKSNASDLKLMAIKMSIEAVDAAIKAAKSKARKSAGHDGAWLP